MIERGSHRRKATLCVVAVAFCVGVFGVRASATDYSVVELSDWNANLEKEHWRAFFGGQTQSALGAALSNAQSTNASDVAGSLEQCGITFVRKERNRFTSPPVASEVSIVSEQSMALSGSLRAELSAIGEGTTARIKFRRSRWVTFEPGQVTNVVHSSVIWSNPELRAKMIECVGKIGKNPIIESVLLSTIIVTFFDKNHNKVDADAVVKKVGSNSYLYNAFFGKGHSYVADNIVIARRKGICINTSIFFKNTEGDVGLEVCGTAP